MRTASTSWCFYSQQNSIRTNIDLHRIRAAFTIILHRLKSPRSIQSVANEMSRFTVVIFFFIKTLCMCTQTYTLIVHMVMRRSVIRYTNMRLYSLDELQYECVHSFLFVQVIHLPFSVFFCSHAACFGWRQRRRTPPSIGGTFVHEQYVRHAYVLVCLCCRPVAWLTYTQTYINQLIATNLKTTIVLNEVWMDAFKAMNLKFN